MHISSNKMNKTTIYILSILLILFAIYTYTHLANWFPNRNNSAEKVIPVAVNVVKQENVVIPLQSIGNVQAYSTVSVKSLVDGELIKVNFKEGDFVKKGQLLFEIDPRPLTNQLHQAQANLAHDQAEYDNAELQYQRNSKLLSKNYISQQDFDQLSANKKALAALVQADLAAVENAKLQLSYASITAPIDGRTGSLQVNVGNIIKTANGTSMLTINQINPISVTFSVPQQYLPPLQDQLAAGPINVVAKIDDYSETGKLTFIDNAIDVSTGTIQLKATFDNKNHRLWPGQFVTVTLPSAKITNALLIPSIAIQEGQTGPYVYVVKSDNTVAYQPVKLGPIVNNRTVITQGLSVNQAVVTAGQMRLSNGAKVSLNQPMAAADSYIVK